MSRTSYRELSGTNEKELITNLKNKQEYVISVEGSATSYCIGMADIVNSTSVNFNNGKMFEFYNIFLNAVTKIVEAHNASLIKKLKDGLLYYFPTTMDGNNIKSFVDVLECGLCIIESREAINQMMAQYHLPSFDFRVSMDYGIPSVSSSRLLTKDIFSPTVNHRSEINADSRPNSLIIGRDLYQIVSSFKHYEFRTTRECMLGLKMNYPMYTVYRKESKIF